MKSRKHRRQKQPQGKNALLALARLSVVGTLAAVTLAVPAWHYLQFQSGQVNSGLLVSAQSDSWVGLGGGGYGGLISGRKSITVKLQSDPKCRFASLGSGNAVSPARELPDAIVFPLEPGTFRPTSPFGPRIDPITGETSMHTGADFSAPQGTPVHAVAAGVVEKAGRFNLEGNAVVIRHELRGEVFYSKYFHLQDNSLAVQSGQHVQAGERIGAMGSTGHSTGSHLHLEIHPEHDHNPIDPVPWLNAHNFKYLGESCDE